MAQKTVLVDDIDGDTATETVTFALDGVNYEIDLNDNNANQLREDLAHWIANARSGTRRRQGVARASTGRRARGANENAVIRAWARENGREVSDRGRLPQELVDAYHAAN